LDEPLNDFVIRPGRSTILWYGEVAGAVTFRVTTDLAVSLSCESKTGCIAACEARREHVLEVQVKRPTRVELRAQNASGTRKTRGTIEVLRSG
jgi:hypothetical protein